MNTPMQQFNQMVAEHDRLTGLDQADVRSIHAWYANWMPETGRTFARIAREIGYDVKNSLRSEQSERL